MQPPSPSPQNLFAMQYGRVNDWNEARLSNAAPAGEKDDALPTPNIVDAASTVAAEPRIGGHALE
jgi:hypothetical protein